TVWFAEFCPVVIERPQFWTAIANDTECNSVIRRASVMKLIDRHAKPGMTLSAFGRLLDNPHWLKKADLTDWTDAPLGGWIPATIDPNHRSSTFSFRVFPNLPGDVYAVYFRVSGQLDRDTLWQTFQKSDQFTDGIILEIATSAGRNNLNWRRS